MVFSRPVSQATSVFLSSLELVLVGWQIRGVCNVRGAETEACLLDRHAGIDPEGSTPRTEALLNRAGLIKSLVTGDRHDGVLSF